MQHKKTCFIRFTADVSTALVDSQMQCYKLEENPAYTIRQGICIATQAGSCPSFILVSEWVNGNVQLIIVTDLFKCEDNPAYTLEATCQGNLGS